MKNFRKKLNNAFTLMEIGLSLLIISVLVIVCIPIITNQVKKTDEYAYFMAFKTVEKLGVQIVSFGDPQESTTVTTSYLDSQFNLKKYLISSSDKFFKFFYPKVDAAIQTSSIVSFPSYEYDFVKVCLGNLNVEKDYDGYSGQWFSDHFHNNENEPLVFAEEIAAIQASPLCNKYKSDNYDLIKKRFMCKNGNQIAAFNILSGVDEERASFATRDYCNWLAQNCSGEFICPNGDCSELYVHQGSKHYYEYCNISITDPERAANYVKPTTTIQSDNTIAETSSCSKYGFVNMDNSSQTTSVVCSCDGLNPVKALNNSNVCCPTPTLDGTFPYYPSADQSKQPCINCPLGAYNEHTNLCCPQNSFYSPALGKCECSEGYTPDNPDSLTVCTKNNQGCIAGTHLEGDKCVNNSPIIKANRFCELIRYNWNVSTHNCETFSDHDGISYNFNLFNAITQDDTPYLSVQAVKGAFIDIEPNIVFANGQMLWILGDKTASIPGLTFNSDNYSPDINVCKLNATATQSTCVSGTNFYCKNDSKCFSINPGAATEGEIASPRLSDARNCCSTSDYSDLILKYEGSDYLRDPITYAISGFTVFVDINGKKDNDELGGGGTLWKDVFPFYIATNGLVYPGYPLNAAKPTETNKNIKDSSALYQGGNSSALSADVFYYDIISNKRKKVNVYPSMPYARALCFAIEISAYTPYCQNLGSKYRIKGHQTRIDNFIYSDDNPCYKHKCFVKLKNKIKFL